MNGASLGDTREAALESALAKWRDRWPEWGLLDVFVPAQQRAATHAWFAWLDELAVAAWGGTDPAPGMAKLAWWQEELHGWAKGARRHPLGMALQSQAVDWAGIARSMGALRNRDAGVAGQIDALARELNDFLRVLALAEHSLFGGVLAASPERILRSLMVSAGVRPDARLGEGRQHGPVVRRLMDVVADRRLAAGGKPSHGFPLLFAGWRAARSR